MKFNIDGLDVYFPYDFIYPEQYEYMVQLYKGIKTKGHCVLEMPSGTGKTISLLSLITSYQYANQESNFKLIYCTRTVPEMEKCLDELKYLIKYRKSVLGEDAEKLIAIGLSARKNLCIHPKVSNHYQGSVVDSLCRNLTATWIREQALDVDSLEEAGIELCDYFEDFEKSGLKSILPNGVYTLSDLKRFGKKYGWCPYFIARRSIEYANIIVYNYSYLLDPKISTLISKELTKDCIVVFDEAHNIDSVCIEVLSANIDQEVVRGAEKNLTTISRRIKGMRKTNESRLKEEYKRLINGLASAGIDTKDVVSSNPVLPSDIMKEAVPGNIRKADHFVGFMRRITEYVKRRLDVRKVISETPSTFLNALFNSTQIDMKALRFCSERLLSLFNTLELKDIHEYHPLRVMADFATLTGTYQEGFAIIIEPYDDRTPSIYNPILQFSCLDASIAIKPVFDKFGTVVITSGTLSPLDFYPKLLNFTPAISKSLPMTLIRPCICPLVMTKGNDQVAVTTSYKARKNNTAFVSVVRNYGILLAELSQIITDGIICFFTSYKMMEDVVTCWHELGMLSTITKSKLVFIETPNTAETAIALSNYRKACDCGRGAIFLSISRGKVAEGIDFDGHYGRCVIMFGVPFVNTESRILKARLEYLNKKFHIRESDFLTFDALRNAAQCIGRVIRNKTDYGIMILADKRFIRADIRGKLPQWIGEHITASCMNLSTDDILTACQHFLNDMSQPWDKEAQFGEVLLNELQIVKLQQRKSNQSGFQREVTTIKKSISSSSANPSSTTPTPTYQPNQQMNPLKRTFDEIDS